MMRTLSRLAAVAGAVGLAMGLSACGLFGGAPRDGAVANRAGVVLAAPGGGASAELVAGPDDGGVATLVPVIREGDTEVFRDETAYSTRHGVAITWESEGATLWVFSSDVGTFRVAHGASGWAKEHATNVPDEVKERVGDE